MDVAGMFFSIILQSCHVQSTCSSFNPTLYISLSHESFHQVFCIPLRLFPGTGASDMLLGTCCHSALLLTCRYHSSILRVIFFVTDATFTDHLTCSLLILSSFVNPHIHRSILISFTSDHCSRVRYFQRLMETKRYHLTEEVWRGVPANVRYDDTSGNEEQSLQNNHQTGDDVCLNVGRRSRKK